MCVCSYFWMWMREQKAFFFYFLFWLAESPPTYFGFNTAHDSIDESRIKNIKHLDMKGLRGNIFFCQFRNRFCFPPRKKEILDDKKQLRQMSTISNKTIQPLHNTTSIKEPSIWITYRRTGGSISAETAGIASTCDGACLRRRWHVTIHYGRIGSSIGYSLDWQWFNSLSL